MNITIRKIQRDDSEIVTDMMKNFYTSPAVITNGSEKIFATNIETCLSGSPYVEGFVFVVDEKIIGYGITAHSYSTEFGGLLGYCPIVPVKNQFSSEAFIARGGRIPAPVRSLTN